MEMDSGEGDDESQDVDYDRVGGAYFERNTNLVSEEQSKENPPLKD